LLFDKIMKKLSF